MNSVGNGTYESIPGSENGDRVRSTNRNKWCIGSAVLVAVVGAVYGATTYIHQHKTSSSLSSSDDVLKMVAAGTTKTDANGKLKLFDAMSMSFCVCLSLCVLWSLISTSSILNLTHHHHHYSLLLIVTYLRIDRYVLEDYDARATFASFLPGVAGYFGKPVWAFYVNRGQAVSTFGTESKDYPILEFNPANKAYQMTPYWGFRTFIRATRGATSFQIEPFAPATSRNLEDPNDDSDKPKRVLYVGTNEVEVLEVDAVHGMSTTINYFILPEENFAALVRRTTIANTGSSDVTMDVLDGLAKMEPFGGPLDGMLKSMGRTLEGWMGVYHGTFSTVIFSFQGACGAEC